jgi:hypothetical protein
VKVCVVLLLQECGGLTDVGDLELNRKRIFASGQAGAFNNRCTTAIIANDWSSAGGWTGSSSGRSGLWIKIGSVMVGSIHSSSGCVVMCDLEPFLNAVNGKVTDENDTIIIGGDMNCEASDIESAEINCGTARRPKLFAVRAQQRGTQKSGGNLDFFVTSPNAIIVSGPRKYRVPKSDHDAVSMTVRV